VLWLKTRSKEAGGRASVQANQRGEPKGQSTEYVRRKAFTSSKRIMTDTPTQRNGTLPAFSFSYCAAQDFYSLRCIQIASPQSPRSLLPCRTPPVVCPVALTHHPYAHTRHTQSYPSLHSSPRKAQGKKEGLLLGSSSPSLPLALPSASRGQIPTLWLLFLAFSHTPPTTQHSQDTFHLPL
jgi:hypothetical protein